MGLIDGSSPADVVRRQYLASAAGDLEALRATLAPDVEWTEMAGFPLAGTYRTPDGVTANVMEKLGADWDGWTAHDDTYVVDGENVVVLARYTAQTGDRQGARRPRRPPLRRARRPDRPLRAVRRHRPRPRRRDCVSTRDQDVENGDFSRKRLVGTVSMLSVAPKADVLATILVIRSWRSASSAAPKNAWRSVVAASGNSSSTMPSMTGASGRERADHDVLGVAERRLRLDRHRRVVDLPPREPRGVVQVCRPAQQRDVGEAGAAFAEPIGWRDRHRLGHQVGREGLAVVSQQLDGRRDLLPVRLLRPDADDRGHRGSQCRQGHQRVPDGAVADVDGETRHAQVEQLSRPLVRGSVRTTGRQAPRRGAARRPFPRLRVRSRRRGCRCRSRSGRADAAAGLARPCSRRRGRGPRPRHERSRTWRTCAGRRR